jgi:hypothetical protein
MDKLEDHIKKNREDLDRYSPSSGVWKRIKRELKKKGSPKNLWFSIAASVIIILGTALVLFRPGNRLTDTNNEISKDNRLTPVNSQLKETEIYYNNLVNSLYREATPMLTANPEIRKELNTDISQLDSIFSEIKKDLKDNVANQDVVEALIQNYRIKIRLLEDMLIILKENENNPEKSKSYEL